MSLSRKRKRELKKLKSYAEDVLNDQKIVLDRAKDVVYEAGIQAKHLSDEYVAPKVNEAYDTVRPTLERGLYSARTAMNNVRRIMAPAVTIALVRAVKALDAVDSPRAHQASSHIVRFGNRAGLVVKQPKKRSAGGIFALGLSVAAATGVAYALWQTFRADDELWIAADEPTSTATSTATSTTTSAATASAASASAATASAATATAKHPPSTPTP